MNWVKQWLQILTELQSYVKQTHTTGVAWNSTRQSKTFDVSRVATGPSSAPAAPKSAGGPPPPPPPPIPNFNDLFAENAGDSSKSQQDSAQQALFASINQGSDITKTLKKVSDDQKTHKNPNLRAANTVPGAPSVV